MHTFHYTNNLNILKQMQTKRTFVRNPTVTLMNRIDLDKWQYRAFICLLFAY